MACKMQRLLCLIITIPKNFTTGRMHTVEPVYYGNPGTNKKCPDYQGVLIFQVSLYDKATPFGAITKCSLLSSVLINSFHCNRVWLS